jgi:hypothetical protein
MSGAVVGRVRDVRIKCENGDKNLYGRTIAESVRMLGETFEYRDFKIPECVPSFLEIFNQRSEGLRKRLAISGKPSECLVLENYDQLTNLITMKRHGANLYFSIMLSANDFTYFAGFIEEHFFEELEYMFEIPFLGFPVDAEAQKNVAASHGLLLPTRLEFQAGEPCAFPNDDDLPHFFGPRLA